ncbi:MAG: hypothetical protein HY235_14685 [Acidobacteria bacterium]|nr:hypothetical protein [Acidobacteriota bacterium]
MILAVSAGSRGKLCPKTMPDLFRMAVENATALDLGYGAVCRRADPTRLGLIERFADRVNRDGAVSLNMRVLAAISFLTLEEHQNIYDWAAFRLTMSTQSEEEILRAGLRGYYERRMVFDGYFDQARLFHYGALTIGGPGATTYGDYCLVFRNQFFEGRREVAYLRMDTLRGYAKTNTWK